MAFALTFQPLPKLDFGGAPARGADAIRRWLAQTGPVTRIVPDFHLGSYVDAEPDGQPSALADGDDINLLYPASPFPPGDEDGVAAERPAGSRQVGDVRRSTSRIPPNLNGRLDAWIDVDRDGSFTTSPLEQIWSASRSSTG